jgi:hypothetical protein
MALDMELAKAFDKIMKAAKKEISYGVLDVVLPKLSVIHERLTVNQRERHVLRTLERLRLRVERWKAEASRPTPPNSSPSSET